MADWKELKADFSGLVTAPGLLVRAEASCIEANNVTFDAPGVVRKRRGFARQADANTGGSVQKVFASRVLDDKVMVHRGGTGTTATVLAVGDGSTALSSVPMIDKTSGNDSELSRTTELRAQMAVSQRNHYVTAAEGVARIESTLASQTQRFAGMPRGLSLAGFQTTSGAIGAPLGAGTALADGWGRSYRVTWHRRDNEGVLLSGAPTGRITIRNITGVPGYPAGAARGSGFILLLPKEIGSYSESVSDDGVWFYRLWGTRTFNASLGSGDDEMYLINEAFVTAADVLAGYATYVDNTPDAFLIRQPTLETNAINYPPAEVGAVQGVANESAPPPVANTIAYWQDVMWYGDCRWRPRLELTMVALPADGDTISIGFPNGNTTTFTFRILPATAQNPALYTGFASTARNIEATCLSLVECINRDDWTAAEGLQAYYVSIGDSLPGRIVLESTVSQAAAVTSPAIVVNPSVDSDWRGSTQSTTDEQANALAFSKPLRADSVPPANLLSVGPADVEILQLQPFRDRLLVFTTGGIYQVTGRTFADFVVSPFDLGYRLASRECVAFCDDRVYAWCREGIVEISDGGVQVVSAPIEPTVQYALLRVNSPLSGFANGLTMLSELAFAVAQRSEHKVHFWYAEGKAATNLGGCCYWLTFDTRTRAWSTNSFIYRLSTGYLDNRSHGVCRFRDDLLVMGNYSGGSDTRLFFERRSFTSSDFVDDAQDGNSYAVVSTIKWQFAIPVADGACHWQQTTLHFDAGEVSWRPLPSSVTVSWETEHSQDTTTITSPTEELSRLEVGVLARRGNRCALSVVDATTAYMGLVGVTQSARVGSRFARRGT